MYENLFEQCQRLTACQREIKGGAFARHAVTFEPDPAAVDFDDALDEGEPNTGTFGFGIQFVEEAEDAFVICGGDADAVIFDEENRFSIIIVS